MSGARAEREAEEQAERETAAEEEPHAGRRSRISPVMREGEQVTPLELFFDLVFVLALTQCTTLIGRRTAGKGCCRACSCSGCCGGRGSATRG